MTYVDTNVLVGFWNVNDSQHTKARRLLPSVTLPIVIHEYVFIETINILIQRGTKEIADAFIEELGINKDIVFQASDFLLRTETSEVFLKENSRALSFTDTMLLVKSRTNNVLTFDKHLNTAITRAKKR